MIRHKLTNIGFVEFKKQYNDSTGWIIVYKYYSKYLNPDHYNLIIFTHDRTNLSIDFDTADYRLCIFNDRNEHLTKLFQYDLYNADMKFNELFGHELRSKTINDILI